MRQSNNKKSRDVTAFLYERLSRDDNLEGESYSIGNQKKLLTKVAKEKGYTNLVHFLDDGISGVTMDRPGFVEMIRQLEEGRAAAVFVKDLSRLGRNYIEVGRLTEEFFPEHDIRLVAVSDNIDTAEGENELAPIRNLFNEWYARDISKKRRISNKIKGNAGDPMGQPPYGYIKDPDNPKRWIVDDEAAQVVRRIYGMTLDGLGTEQIAAQLEREGILTPRAYWLQKGIKRPGKGKQQPPTKWNSSTITKILSLQEYCGDILNFKTYSKSYKNKKRIENDRENWVIFKDVHESIIDRAVWEQVQQKRGKIRKRRTNDGERNMFSGLLVCADCGNNLHFHFNQGNPDIKYFNCSNYKGNRGTCTSTHYVRVDFLEQVVLSEIKRLTRFASHYEDDFVKAVMGSTQESVELDRRLKQKELALGILCGAMLFSGATAAAAGITAEPTWQNIYVDGAQVSMTAYNIAGSNYVKLRDIGQQVGFNVYWQDGVQIDTDTPYTGVAPVQGAEALPTIEEIRQEMIRRINEVRKENGVSELAVNQSLMDASQECSSKLHTSHKNLVECQTVLACGYPHGFGSNLTVLIGTGMNRIAEKAVTNWVNSPGHFETMIDADCDTLGVGVTIDNGRAFCYMMVGNPNAYNPYA